MNKFNFLRSASLIAAVGLGLSGCAANQAGDDLQQGMSALHVPVVTHATYVFDAAAPGGVITPSEIARLNGWLQSIDMRYGDVIYVDSPGGAARGQIAALAGNYGLLVSEGAPVTPGQPGEGNLRVVISRAQASVPGCPDFRRVSEPDFLNRSTDNFGCGVNAALAAQVADPNDLLHGRMGQVAADGATGAKAITMYRNWPLTAIVPGQQLRPLKQVEQASHSIKGN